MDKTFANKPLHKAYGDQQTILDTTDARQGNSRKMNLRVLFVSLLLGLIAGLVLVGAFWKVTPSSMDATAPPPVASVPLEQSKPDARLPQNPASETAPAPAARPTP